MSSRTKRSNVSAFLTPFYLPSRGFSFPVLSTGHGWRDLDVRTVCFRRSSVPHCGVTRPERYNATDWARALKTLPRSIVLRRIRGHIVANTVTSTAVFVGHEAFARFAPHIAQRLHLTTLPHTFMVTAMSLLLVLRSNAAYDRFWEGRKLWGSLVNTARNAARICVITMPRSHSNIAGKLIVCFAYALMHHLQGRREEEPFGQLCTEIDIPIELSSNVPFVLSADDRRETPSLSSSFEEYGKSERGGPACPTWSDVEWDETQILLPKGNVFLERINSAENKPLEIILLLSTLIKASLEWKDYSAQLSGHPPPFRCNGGIEREKLELCVVELINILGKCERIVKSPVPLSWNRHTSRLISLWTLTLPLALVPIQGPLCIPTVAVISWVLFSIEEIGHILEDPFRMERYSIPLIDICETIQNDVFEQILSRS